MALFGKKREKTLDLTERYMKQKERMENLRESRQKQPESAGASTGFNFLAGLASSAQSAPQNPPVQTYSSENEDEKKRKLAKRLMDITDKLEEISNQLYHLQQRVEVLEKKMNPGGLGF